MATALKCPNPSCPYLFDPSTLPTGVVLACQRCGMRFTLGAPQAAPPPPADPSNFPPAAEYPQPPAGSPSTATVRPSDTSTSPGRAEGATSAGPPAAQSRLQTYMLAGVTAVALAAGGVAIWHKVTHNSEESYSGDNVSRFKELNLGFEPPPSPWTRDEDIKATLGSPFFVVYRRDNPEAYMAFGARDYVTRPPRDSELRQGLTQALEKIVDPVTLKQEDPLEHTWMGQEVKGIKFHAQLRSGGTVDGEAYRTSYRGVGYWFLSWTGENNIFDEMHPSFVEARKHCQLLDYRTDWKAKESANVPFKGDHISYTVLDAEGVWEEEKDESNLKYEGADKILHMKRGKNKDAIQDGYVMIYLLPAVGDPATEAREHVTRKERKRIGDIGIEFSDAPASRDGEPIASPVANPLPVLRLQSKVKGAASQNRFHAISATKVEDKIVAVHAYCDLANREFLEPILVSIAGSLHGN